MKRVRDVLLRESRAKIEAAYTLYLIRAKSAENALFEAITEFARSKVCSALYESEEAHMAPEDHAQELAVYVWERIGGFKGSSASFFSWVHQLCHAKATQALDEEWVGQQGKIELFVEDEEGSGFLETNPELYSEKTLTIPRPLPKFIQGVDRLICDLIGEGLKYKEIADTLNITEAAVKMRTQRMKQKAEKYHAENKKA